MKTPIQSGGKALPDESRDPNDAINDAETKILRARDLAELMFLAGEGCHQPAKNALTAGADVITEVLREALDFLAEARASAKGGAA